jgi:predicted dehydrogenase
VDAGQILIMTASSTRQPVTAVLLGAGQRGLHDYGPYALARPEDLRFVAVAEPREDRRRRFAEAHRIPREMQFADWRDLMTKGRLAEACLNATQDRAHHASSLAAIEAGYDVLLEKPIATRLDESVSIVRAAEAKGCLLEVCHVLRHTAFFAAVHDVLAQGTLGDLVSVEHRENVGHLHMAHSFVRGNWSRADVASPMILAKCCHDLDLLVWNVGRPVTHVQSFGSLLHFRPEKAPAGATPRCTDGCPVAAACSYDARRAYLDPGMTGWPVSVITDDLSAEGRLEALRAGPYGRCVYAAGNDVVDHQTVSLEFEGGVTGLLTMQGHTPEEDRTMRYDGTRGTLTGRFSHARGEIEVVEHRTGKRTRLDVAPTSSGHGGGDFGLLGAFVATLRSGTRPLHHAREALESHLLAHAAEESRARRVVVSMDDFRRATAQA